MGLENRDGECLTIIVSPIGRNWSMFGRQNLRDEKVTRHPFDNTNRAILSKTSFGSRQPSYSLVSPWSYDVSRNSEVSVSTVTEGTMTEP